MSRQGFSVRRASVFPHVQAAAFEKGQALSYLSGTGFGRKADGDERRSMSKMKLWGRTVRLPRSRLLRVVMGFAFVGMGLVGFLPVVGFWMIPVGLAILSVDSPLARRFRRRAEVWVLRRYNRWKGRGVGSA
ncbi:hypothetical protein KL86PLE_30153 [uncultured Pleomorphomonas sp.]|nr:hypothetical protein KL86PLE_30153 [uncultured Pleomorphomonas sp.]